MFIVVNIGNINILYHITNIQISSIIIRLYISSKHYTFCVAQQMRQ